MRAQQINTLSNAILTVLLLVAISSPAWAAASWSKAWGSGGSSFVGDWSIRKPGPRQGGYNDPEMLKIQPESIVIHAYYDGHVIRTAAVSTIGSFAMASGVVLARIKACFKAPLRTAIWLQSPANKASHGKIGAGREIDIAEIYTSRMPLAPAEVAHNIHSGGYGEMHQHTGSPTSKVHACQYHNYKAEFGEFGYKFYVDGELQWQTGQSFQGHKEYIIFNVGTPAHLQYHWPSPRSLGFAKLISVKVKETGNE